LEALPEIVHVHEQFGKIHIGYPIGKGPPYALRRFVLKFEKKPS
jgi:hypothetical protein